MHSIQYHIQVDQRPDGGYDVHVNSSRGSSVAFGVNPSDLPALLSMCLQVELVDAGIVS